MNKRIKMQNEIYEKYKKRFNSPIHLSNPELLFMHTLNEHQKQLYNDLQIEQKMGEEFHDEQIIAFVLDYIADLFSQKEKIFID